MPKPPDTSDEIQREHAGRFAACVNGKIVATDDDSVGVLMRAERKGYRVEEVEIVRVWRRN